MTGKIDLKVYNEMVEKKETITNKINKAKGSIDTLKSQLEKDYKLMSIKETRRRLRELQSELNEEEKELLGKLNQFQKEWSDKL